MYQAVPLLTNAMLCLSPFSNGRLPLEKPGGGSQELISTGGIFFKWEPRAIGSSSKQCQYLW